MHRTTILFTAAAGLVVTLSPVTAQGASTLQLTERTEEVAAQHTRSFMDEFAANALRSRDAAEFAFRHFGDLFVRDDDRAMAGNGLSGTVTAAVFGGGNPNGKGFAFGGSGNNGKKGSPPGLMKGNGKGLGGNAGPGAGPGPGGGGQGVSGGGGGGGGNNAGGIDFGGLGDGDGASGDAGFGSGGSGFDDKFNGGNDGPSGGNSDGAGGNVAAIPLPPAVWLGLVGLAAVGWARRRSITDSGTRTE